MPSFASVRGALARRLALASLALLVLSLAACGGSESVATIDDDPVTFDEVADLVPFEGDTIDPELFARSIMLVIAGRVMTAGAEREFGVTRTEAEIDAKVDELIALTGQPEEEIYEYYNLTPASLRVIAAQEVMADKIIPELVAGAPAPTEAELRLRYEAALPNIVEVCSSHILLETEEGSMAALERAEAGEDFGALAVELSVGPSGPSGGDLGCSSPGGYVPEFANAVMVAEPGVPYGPVQTEFGWHVILVADRTAPSFEELRDTLTAEIQSTLEGQLWSDWLTQALLAADIEVEPEYGTWTTDPIPNVIAPLT